MKKKNGVLTFFGVVMILFALFYALLGTLSLVGTVEGILPGHEQEEIVIIVLSYVVALVSLVGGIACVKGNKTLARVIGIIFALVGFVSLVYLQIAQETFSTFDCIAMLLGLSVVYQTKDKE